MLLFDTIKAKGSKNPQRANELIYQMVRDLEKTREDYKGYSYVRTMRNILIGKKDAAIAPYFVDKPYYGIYTDLSLERLEGILDVFVKTQQLKTINTDHGKLYCTHDYYQDFYERGRL